MSKTIKTDLDLMIAVREHEDALLTAKKGKDPGKLAAAKSDLRELRKEWRQVREAFSAPADGEARPEPVKVKGKVN